MQYPIIDNLIYAYLRNGWNGGGVNNLIQIISPNIRGFNVNKTSGINDLIINSGFSFTINRTGDNYIGDMSFSAGEKADRGIFANVKPDTDYTYINYSNGAFTKNFATELGNDFNSVASYMSLGGTRTRVIHTSNATHYLVFRFGSENFRLDTEYTTKISLIEGIVDNVDLIPYDYTSMIYENIARRLKLPMIHYFPHPVIDALQRAAAGTQTVDDTEILRHYLTPLGIGGI